MKQTRRKLSKTAIVGSRPLIRLIVFLAGMAATEFLSIPVLAAAKPNVVFILADDLGWSDTTLYGTTTLYKTPNIERLAARGMTFTRAYSSSPLCSPTRASVLTGLSPARHGITSPNCHLPKVTLRATAVTIGPPHRKATIPSSVSRLDTGYYTLDEMFKDNGYATGHFGKWHLGAEPYSPLQHGFDVDIPHHPGPGPAGSYVAPWKFKDFDHDPDVPDQHIEDRMAMEAVAFMEKHKEGPFFLNYWMFSVHAPFDAKRALIDEYRKQVDPQDPQRSPTYAAMIESMDDAVGTLLDTLDRLGVSDKTIIVFASDNGGNMYNEVDGTTATSNAPLRGGKATMYEGGVRGPAIVAYPEKVEAASRSDEVIQSSDFYPTLLELLGIQAQPEQTFDGISIVSALQGKSLNRDAIFTYFPHAPNIPDWLPPSVSVHAGDWKLIRIFHGGDDGAHRYKLFNLREDLGEKTNLAVKMPKKVKELDAKIERFLDETQAVRPLRNPRFDPARYRPNIIVFYTDDHGHADLSCQGVVDDIRTPHVDALAKSGVLARHGYSTAPQCVPSRAGLMVGKFQSRFGVEANGRALDGFDRELTIAERLQDAGYVTAQFGKWHLGPGPQITRHGFKHVFSQNSGRPFAANITLDGEDREMSNLPPKMYHIDGCSRAAASLIDRYNDQPFFLYVAYRAPHVPLDAPQKYLDRFPGKMPRRRRQALAMLSAVDDGVGLISNTLAKHDLTQKTLIFYIGDNGAPLKIHKLDAPGGGPGWDGSLNDPLNGEKGMLAEGGMHVPFVISWPGTIPAGQIYDHPVSALDVAATAAEIAHIKTKAGDLDGANLIPHLTGKTDAPPHEVLTWRWSAQSAIRAGKWKLLRGGDREYLYDLDADIQEKHNLATKHPQIATRLREKLSAWADELDPPGLAVGGMSRAASDYFDYYLEGKPPTRSRVKPTQDPTANPKKRTQAKKRRGRKTPTKRSNPPRS